MTAEGDDVQGVDPDYVSTDDEIMQATTTTTTTTPLSPPSGNQQNIDNDELNNKLIEVNSKVRNVLSKVILAIDFTNTSRQDFQHLQIDSYRKRGFALTSFVSATDDDYYKIANFYQEHTDGIQVYGAAAQFDGAAPYNLNSDVFYLSLIHI